MSADDVAGTASVDRAAIEVLAATPGVLRALLAGLPREVLEAPNDEGWSLKDIVAHLHDAEGIAFVERIDRILREERPFINSIDPPARLIASGYASRGLDELLDELHSQRETHSAWLAALSAAELAAGGRA